MKGLFTGLALLLALGILFFFYTTQTLPSSEMTAGEHEAIALAVMGQADAMMEAWNAHDLEATYSFSHPEKTAISWAGTIYDYDGLKERWAYVWGQYDDFESAWTSKKIEVLSDEAVLFQGSYELRLFYPDGREQLYPGTCHWTVLYEPYEGEWKMTYGAYTYGGAQWVEEGKP